jgi:hypothetical protein
MNDVRNQLRNGIPESEAAAFRTSVRDVVHRVENMCRAHRTSPEALPGPSARAYAYLKVLDLDNLPGPRATPIVPRGSIKVSGIITVCNTYHDRFSKLILKQPGTYTIATPSVQDLARTLQTEVQAIGALCEEAGGSPAALPVQSERGYQWLSFLSDPARLARHLETLGILYQAGRKYGVAAAKLSIRIYATSALYRARTDGPRQRVLVNEGFIAASSDVLRALGATTLGGQHDDDTKKALRAYSLTPAFLEVQTALQAQTDALVGSAQGQRHDLDAAFDRVNRTYFGGKATHPNLVWSRQPTDRKMGHYDPVRDTIWVSVTLDTHDVPTYVIDFVVYHELLHRELGAAVINGRRRAHTPAFRREEHAFKDYDRVQSFIKTYNLEQD